MEENRRFHARVGCQTIPDLMHSVRSVQTNDRTTQRSPNWALDVTDCRHLTDEVEVIHAKGSAFGFPFHWAVELKGDALTGANRLADALAVRKERLAQIEAVAAPDEVGAATMGVRFQIAQLEQRIAAGKSGGAQ
ncbi:MAG: hypothetical protein ACOYOU_08385 [Kiritimatiellia bacterium]